MHFLRRCWAFCASDYVRRSASRSMLDEYAALSTDSPCRHASAYPPRVTATRLERWLEQPAHGLHITGAVHRGLNGYTPSAWPLSMQIAAAF